MRNALSNNLVELADEVRAEMSKRAGAEHLEELAGTIDVIGGNTELDRRFVRLGVLGKGGVGEVVRAVDLADGHQVALKQIDLRSLPEGGRKAAMNAVKTEYGAASQLDDPRFARVLDLRIAPGGSLYIVQRFVDGTTLRQIYASDEEPDRLLELLAGTAEALSVLHAHSVVHRDLKHENVIVTRGDRGAEWPVLIDLGIALVTRSEDALKHFGTPPYIAPEQASGGSVDASADVYALGQMVAEVWDGSVQSSSGLGRLWSRDSEGQMPRDAGELVREMLAPDPARRISDLSSIAQALRSLRQQVA